jgi:hypothetical protein
MSVSCQKRSWHLPSGAHKLSSRLEIGSVGRDRFLVPFKANARHSAMLQCWEMFADNRLREMVVSFRTAPQRPSEDVDAAGARLLIYDLS